MTRGGYFKGGLVRGPGYTSVRLLGHDCNGWPIISVNGDRPELAIPADAHSRLWSRAVRKLNAELRLPMDTWENEGGAL
jgi:hypothetical protein